MTGCDLDFGGAWTALEVNFHLSATSGLGVESSVERHAERLWLVLQLARSAARRQERRIGELCALLDLTLKRLVLQPPAFLGRPSPLDWGPLAGSQGERKQRLEGTPMF